MPLLSCPSINPSHFCTIGDVKIDDGVAIAPGVILQADPDCQIVIRSGVCLGMGTILHAHRGNLEIQAGAVLGAGVLVLGTGKIGANACIGATTTVLNVDIDPERVIAPGSVVGKIGREITGGEEKSAPPQIPPSPQAVQATFVQSTFVQSTFVPTPPIPLPASTFISPPPRQLSTFVDPNPNSGFGNSTTNSNNSQNSNSSGSQNLSISSGSQNLSISQNSAPNSQGNSANSSEPSETKPEAGTENNHQFYGKNRLDRLLGTLMPQNKPLP